MNAQTCLVLGRGEPSDLGNAWNPRSRVGGEFIMIGHKLVKEDIVGTALNVIKNTSSTSGQLDCLTFVNMCCATHTSAVWKTCM